MPTPFQKRIVEAGILGGGKATPYYQQIKNLFGSALIQYIPLKDTTGTTATDISGNSRNGAYVSSPTLNQTGIGDGLPSIRCATTAPYVNLFSSGLASAFNGSEGMFLTWFKPDASLLTDADSKVLTYFKADANNYIKLARVSAGNDNFGITYAGGGTTIYSHYSYVYQSQFAVFGMGWSYSGNKIGLYYNGCESTGYLTVPTFTGALTVASIGYQPFAYATIGNYQHSVLLNRIATQKEIIKFGDLFSPSKHFTIIGDSISSVLTDGYVPKFPGQYKTGYNSVLNHAFFGATIATDLPNEVTSSASDNADIIIIHLGTNDNNSGDMNVLKTTIGNAIDILRSTNPKATIYYMNVLPRWTDNTGATPMVLSNIRTAISQICTTKSVTCWDTFTTPWITAADTSDGAHPNSGGSDKIVTKVLNLLP